MGECARDLLRTRLATAVSGDDILSALAVETELLTLCRKRQELVASILENEERLAGLLTPPDDTVEPLSFGPRHPQSSSRLRPRFPKARHLLRTTAGSASSGRQASSAPASPTARKSGG